MNNEVLAGITTNQRSKHSHINFENANFESMRLCKSVVSNYTHSVPIYLLTPESRSNILYAEVEMLSVCVIRVNEHTLDKNETIKATRRLQNSLADHSCGPKKK